MPPRGLVPRNVKRAHYDTMRNRFGQGPKAMERLQDADMLRLSKEKKWSSKERYPNQLTVGEVKGLLYGTPYHREAGDVKLRLPQGDKSDLACGMHKVLTAKDRKVIGNAMTIFARDQRDIPGLSKVELKRVLKAMGILPTSDDKKQLVFQVCRGLASAQHGGGAVVLDESAPPASAVTAKVQAAVRGASKKPSRPSQAELEDAIGELAPPAPIEGLMPVQKVAPRTIRLTLGRDRLFIENLSDQVPLDMGGCRLVAVMRRRKSTAPQPEDDGFVGGAWSPSEQNASFVFPAGLSIPPQGELQVGCGERWQKHSGQCADFAVDRQMLCWHPTANPLATCWAITLLDKNGNRNQMVTADVLRRRRRHDRRQRDAAPAPTPADALGSASPPPIALFEEFAREIDAAYSASQEGEDADLSADLPGPDYRHEAIGLRRLVALKQAAEQPLIHPDEQGIVPEERNTNKVVGKGTFVNGWRTNILY
eukprot:TRINITY_DN16844_c0_g1_i1.p1 TRINITY_DN16844_c0_g1~~TRINITY_DN16844_c0_g1_i1.p1  ORF type:complete len:480 (+),score=162.13 TRINITY_DN16844_c0_g1_i1:90-1529(+)